MITKNIILQRLAIVQTIGYGILLFLIIGDEVFDLPHTVFGQRETPINWAETIIESGYILLLGTLSITLSYGLIRRVRFFEGYVPICSYCKRIRDNNEWMTLEEYVTRHSEAMLSHGICPQCKEEHFPHRHPSAAH